MTWPPLFSLYIIARMPERGPIGIDLSLAVVPVGHEPPDGGHLYADDLDAKEIEETLAEFRQAQDIRFVKGWPP